MRFTARLLAATALVSAGLAGAAAAQDFSLKFQSSDPAGNANFLLQQEWAKDVAAKTDGRVEVDLLPVETIVAHTESQDLIANPVGAWSDPQQMFDFMENGGGNELMNEMLEPYGLHFIGATTPGLEAFLSKVPLDGVDDLEGLKMRAPEGMVQKVFAAAGASPVNLPGSEVFTSLDKGVIDAADYTVFSTNHAQGMHDVANHPVYPGFHSMPLVEVSINKGVWDSMPEDIQSALVESVKDFRQLQVSTLAERDMAAVKEAEANADITVHNWSDEERAKFRAFAKTEWEKAAEASDASRKVYDTLTAYLEENGLLQ